MWVGPAVPIGHRTYRSPQTAVPLVLQVSSDLGSSDPLTPDVPPSATYPVLDNYLVLARLLIA